MELRLHERDAELADLEAALGAAATRRGAAIVLEGPAGIGKSSLLDATRAAAPGHGLAVAAARGSDLETAYAWGVVRQLLEARLRGMAPESRARALDGAAALAGPVVLPGPEAGEVNAETSFGVLHGLYWLVANLAAGRPQLLLVDDLQWADAASARFLAFLANRVEELPVLLLAAQRPGAARLPGAAVRTLAPLSAAGTAALLAEDDGGQVPAGLAAACHDATGGNPLLLRRLAAELPRDGGADPHGDLVSRIGPDALAGVVGATIERLGEDAARLARAVAVLDRAPLAMAAALAVVDDGEALAERLVRAGILRDARPLEFAHALVRDAVLTGMSAGERARGHAAAAELLRGAGAPAEAIAAHLLHTEPRGDPAASAALDRGGPPRARLGRARRGRGEPRSRAGGAASGCGAAALAPRPGPRRARHRRRGDRPRPRGLRRRRGRGDPGRGRALPSLVGGPGQQAPEEAMTMFETALEGIAGRDRELELRLESARMTAAFQGPELMAQIVGTAERFADLPGRTQGECELLLHVSLHRFVGGRPAAEVAEPLERVLAFPPALASMGPDSFYVPFVVGQLYKGDRLGAARRLTDWQLAESARRGSVPGFVLSSLWRAWIALREGDATAAEADARAAYELVTDVAWHRDTAVASLVDVLVDRGALDEARALLDAVVPEGEVALDVFDELLLSTRSHLRAAAGDALGALEDQLAARRAYGDHLKQDPDPNFPGWLRLARARYARATRTVRAARATPRSRTRGSGGRRATSARRSRSPGSSAGARRAWRCCTRRSPSWNARPRGAS